ncbi:unnamed protein product [Microthlaspi erraticum]|uniref:NB-ARC domain-containing protein n=1 Tax=Microthlaspi erraticum TaxID=1685480 RepID=A0A6D2IN48_9BRAS|nr:unnamed protein product [Microthlaspi erraticum]
MDDGTQIMGLYGMGGVGKTTLLEQINNKFKVANDDGFEKVIWVVVSSNLLIEKIQDEIAEKLGFPRENGNKREKKKATDIHTRLKNKKFVLLLDDIGRSRFKRNRSPISDKGKWMQSSIHHSF